MICFAITRCATQLDPVVMQVVNTSLIIGRDRDLRKNGMRWQNAENNDDITAVDFHPSRENLLLIGGDDGLVSIFDVNVAEEDDSLVQGVTHGPIHKAGFLHANALFALSSDQNLALHPVYSPERDQEPAAARLGDLRSIVPCEYVIDVVRTGGGFGVATGSHR
jgi:WD repeat-containing protein 89